ncbi:unnamed protein product, partial [Iphiclides podalirius]
MIVNYLILAIIIGAAYAQTEPSASDVLKALPSDLQGTVNESQIQDIQNKSTKAFREKCEKNGGPDAYSNAEAAFKKFMKCTEDLVNFQVLNEEIEKAKPDGRVDEVFKKYCDKRPVFMSCFRNATEAVEPCLAPAEREHLKPFHNVTEQLGEFICFKDGDRIALFIAEKGPECLKEKSEMINECVNKTFNISYKFNPNEFPDTIPEINLGEKECNQITEVQKCVVKSLETCSVPTSANIIESLFKFARKSLPCKELPETTQDPNSGCRVAATLTLTAAIFAKMLV